MIKPAYFVYENMKTDAVFQGMQENKSKVAIVVDEYGGVCGMVTMEDLVEEIVGDIYEDYEEVEVPIRKLSSDSYEIMGWTLINDINEELHTKIESEYDTISGYVIELLDYIPSDGECSIKVSDEEADYLVEEVKDRVITRLKMTLKPKAEDLEEAPQPTF